MAYQILTDNITKTTSCITQKNEDLYTAFKYQLEDPKTKEKTAVIFPLVVKIYGHSDSIVEYIFSTKKAIAMEEQKGNTMTMSQLNLHSLYDSLIHFQSVIFNIDPELNHQFKDSTYILNICPDTSWQSFERFERTFLSVKFNQAYIGLLSVLENKIRKLENDMIRFCYSRITRHGCFDEKNIPLLFQDKTIAAGGDSVEITAALGEISTQNNPEMTIMGQKIPANDMGLMIYKLKTSGTKGKHPIPVTIDFTNNNTGVRTTVSKTLYYTIR
ncbi:MAG: hypothetical protein QM802_10505 [Agriterribacter sp.]